MKIHGILLVGILILWNTPSSSWAVSLEDFEPGNEYEQFFKRYFLEFYVPCVNSLDADAIRSHHVFDIARFAARLPGYGTGKEEMDVEGFLTWLKETFAIRKRLQCDVYDFKVNWQGDDRAKVVLKVNVVSHRKDGWVWRGADAWEFVFEKVHVPPQNPPPGLAYFFSGGDGWTITSLTAYIRKGEWGH